MKPEDVQLISAIFYLSSMLCTAALCTIALAVLRIYHLLKKRMPDGGEDGKA